MPTPQTIYLTLLLVLGIPLTITSTLLAYFIYYFSLEKSDLPPLSPTGDRQEGKKGHPEDNSKLDILTGECGEFEEGGNYTIEQVVRMEGLDTNGDGKGTEDKVEKEGKKNI